MSAFSTAGLGREVKRYSFTDVLAKITPAEAGPSTSPPPDLSSSILSPPASSGVTTRKKELVDLLRVTPKLNFEITESELLSLIDLIEGNHAVIEYLKQQNGVVLNRNLDASICRSIFVRANGNIVIQCKNHRVESTGVGSGGVKNVTYAIGCNDEKIYAFASMRLSFPKGFEPTEEEKLQLRNDIRCARSEAVGATLFRGLDNMVQYVDVITYEGSPKNPVQKQGLLMEFYDGGDFLDLLNNILTGDVDLDYDQTVHLFYGMLNGICQVHRQGYIHRDIKPENFFLSKVINDDKIYYTPHLGDFGFLIFNQSDEKTKVLPGSKVYFAPECWRYTNYLNLLNTNPEAGEVLSHLKCELNRKMDVYAFGVILGTLFFGRFPPEEGVEENFGDIFYRDMKEPEEKTIEHLIWRMTRSNPHDRISSEEALDLLEPALKEFFERDYTEEEFFSDINGEGQLSFQRSSSPRKSRCCAIQ